MKGTDLKDGITLILFVAFIITASLYFGARDDIDRLRQANLRMFNMLPAHQQEMLVGEDRLRGELLDPGPYRSQ